MSLDIQNTAPPGLINRGLLEERAPGLYDRLAHILQCFHNNLEHIPRHTLIAGSLPFCFHNEVVRIEQGMDEHQGLGVAAFQVTNSTKCRHPNSPRRQHHTSKNMRPAMYFLFRPFIQHLFILTDAGVACQVETQQFGAQRRLQILPICLPPQSIGVPIQPILDQYTAPQMQL